jgi:MSHA biogenesis protein MshJ
LRREIGETESRILEEQRRFTGPEQMRSVLEEMLGRNRRVALLSMKTLSPRAFGGAKPAAEAPAALALRPTPQADRPVYRHAMELTVAGSYFDLLAYLADMEHLPTQLDWSGVELDAAAYPILKMRLVVFTLSLNKAWMNV